MKKTSNPVLGVFSLMIAAAPLLDMSTRCFGPFGEPEYPEE